MKVSQLKQACERYLAVHGDSEVKLCWEEGALTEGYQPRLLEQTNDARAVSTWPLPGTSLMIDCEDHEYQLVIFYSQE